MSDNVSREEGRGAGEQGSRGAARDRQVLVTVAVIFAVSLITKLLWIRVPTNVDEGSWIIRAPRFYTALLTGDFTGTYASHHPGVTNMWLIGLGLALRYLTRGLLPLGDLARQSASFLGYLQALIQLPATPLGPYISGRAVFAVVTSSCMVGFYLLSRRLWGGAIALLATAILLFEPFFLAYERLITTDSNQANFTWLSLLAFLIYLKELTEHGRSRRGWMIFSGAFFGLAMLSKVPSVLNLPVYAACAVWAAWRLRGRGPCLRLALDLLLWGFAAFAAAFAFWPAWWVDLPGTLARQYAGLMGEVQGHDQFFLGQTTATPGPLYYPVVMAFRVSPLVLLGSLFGVASLLLPRLRRYVPGREYLGAALLDVVVVMAGFTSFGSKHDRYLVVVVPGLALLTAAGIWAALSWWADRRGQTGAEAGSWAQESTLHSGEPSERGARAVGRRYLGWALIGVLVVQLAVLLPHVPYYLTYFNPLLGGPAAAYKKLMVGNGELLDQAGAWLNAHAGEGASAAASGYTSSLAPYFGERTLELLVDPTKNYYPLRDANYVVLYGNQLQRGLPADLVSYFSPQKPVYTVRRHGVNYALIYPGPAVRRQDVERIPNPMSLDFGGKARLLGYELETPQVKPGEPAVLALYWEALAPFDAPDYSVYVGVTDPEGNRFGKVDSIPVGSMMPVDQWRPGMIVRDVQQVPILPGTPQGEYSLDLGFFSPQIGQALEIRDENGPRGNRIPLTQVAVTKADASLAETADLGIANPIAGDIALFAGGPRLLGYDWSQPDAALAGDAIPTTLLWQAATERPGDVRLYLQLSSGAGVWRRAMGHALGGGYPADRWLPGELVRDAWQALLPVDAPAGRYRVELVAATPAGDRVLLSLGEVELKARPHSFEAPRPTRPQRAALGGQQESTLDSQNRTVELVGYDIPEEAKPGEPLAVTLHWQALAESPKSYVRFVHLLDGEGRIVAQQDSVPGQGELSTTGWVPGEYLVDRVQLGLPPDLPEGQYRLEVGLYDPITGQRLADAEGRDMILLQQPVVVR
jgi:4-amino-4-deoxy-L-arabinose transferase-like glycosyltransferase